MDIFGDTLILSDADGSKLHLARACFEAMPKLLEISVWTQIKNEEALERSSIRLEHERTWFWFDRDSGTQNHLLTAEDLADDKAAAAIARFQHQFNDSPAMLAFDKGLDAHPAGLFFYRSGAIRLISNVWSTLEEFDGRDKKRPRAKILPNIYPVFATTPTGHELVAWAKSLDTDFHWFQLPAATAD